uniref:Tripartite motif-containing protein 26-like n=1 Tax=Spermophilus dauricus TaxID=99837 RepID=A0A8C9UX22_SPEDA
MAAASPLRNLEDEVLCSICLDYLREPVTIDCGHVFCYHCIIKVCESSRQPLYCSLCKTAFKKENIRHVWQMASLVENIWRMKVDEERQPREERSPEQRAEKLCGRHLEKLHYYCKDDQQILCVMCRESREHRNHAAVLLEKAAQPYRGKILNHLKILKGDRDRIQNFQSTGEDEIQALLIKFQGHRQDIVTVFEQGHQFLREREQFLLDLLMGMEQELTEGRSSHITKGSEEVVRLGTLISELEKKVRQPALELLQIKTSDFFQFIVNLSISFQYPRKKFWIEKPISPAIKKRAEEFSDKIISLEKGLRGFHGNGMGEERGSEPRKLFISVFLGFDSANGYLSVSPNGKSMIFTGLWMNKYQHGQRFDPEPGVLGSKGFTWGKVYWEVKVDRIWWGAEEEEEAMKYRGGARDVFGSSYLGGFIGITDGYSSPGYRNESEELEEEWSQENGIWPKFCLLGVARESVVRRGFLAFTPEEGFWTLQLSSAGVSICTNSEPFQILSYCPRQIGIALDYDGGKVTFTNARTQEFIYEFSSSFTGRIFPFLWLNCMRSRLTLRP